MKNNDFTNLKKYHSRWVAIDQKEDENIVVGIGDTLEEALKQSQEKGVKNPMVTRAPANYGAFIL